MIFCPNFSNKQVKQEFEELVQAVGEDMAYLLWDRNNGYALDKAPNGADSRLFKELLDYYQGDRIKTLQQKGKTYLQRFKDQVGDSSDVDENGEYLAWYVISLLENEEYAFTQEEENYIDKQLIPAYQSAMAYKAASEGKSTIEIVNAELDDRDKETPESDTIERENIRNEREALKDVENPTRVTDRIRNAYRRAKRAARRNKKFITFISKGRKTATQEEIDKITTKIIEGTISKQKSSKSKHNQHVDSNQIVENQEAVRNVKMHNTRISEAVQSGNDCMELLQKLDLFSDFISRANQEITNCISLVANAKANNYRRVFYNTDPRTGRKIYTDDNGELLNASSAQFSEELDFDQLTYTHTDVVGYYFKIISEMQSMLDNINLDFLPQNPSSEEQQLLENIQESVQALKDLLRDSNIIQRVSTLQNMYIDSLRTKVEQYINEAIDELDSAEIDGDKRERLRVNTIKWLKDQFDYGDVKAFERYVGIGSRSKSILIRLVQEIIDKDQNEVHTAAMQVGLELNKLYRNAIKASKWKGRFAQRNYQKRMAALDRRGLTTGYFIEPINKGQYYQDLEDYRAKLLYTRGGVVERIANMKDENGRYIFRDENGEFNLEINQFGDPVFPEDERLDDICKEYFRDMERWICHRANRRFTEKYYLERIDYLSPSTLRLLNEVQSKINDVLKAGTVDGEFRPDLLTDSQLDDLHRYQEEYSELSNPYNPDGTIKDDEDEYGKAAKELTNWNAHIAGKIQYVSDMDMYEKAREKARNKKEFDRMFTKRVINPLLWSKITKKPTPSSMENMEKELNILKKRRSKLLSYVRGEEFYQINWDKLYDENTGEIKSLEFFKELARLDSKIKELSKTIRDTYLYDENDIKFSDIFDYVYLAGSNSQYDLVPDLIGSKFEEMKYGYIKFLRTKGLSESEIDEKIESTFYAYDNPLSIFTTPYPKQLKQFHSEGKVHNSIIRTPIRMFSKIDFKNSSKEYVNEDFDTSNQQAVQIKDALYHDKRYDEFVNESEENRILLNRCIELMGESYKKIPFSKPYDGRLVQVGESRFFNIMMRKFFSRFGKNLAYWFNRWFMPNESDVDLVQYNYTKRPDGSDIKNIPVRYLQMLEKPEYISTNIIGNVVLFWKMAENYKVKSKSAPKVQAIIDAAKSYAEGTSSNQISVLEGMMDRQYYENLSTGLGKNYGDDKKWKYFDWVRRYIVADTPTWLKHLGQIRAISSLGMLGLNLRSAVVSFWDTAVSLGIDASTGRYINKKDLFFAMSRLTINSFRALASLGRVNTYSKITAGMQYFGLSKGIYDTFKNTDQSALRRFISDGILMKGFTIGDYTINALNMTATMRAYRKYVNEDGTHEWMNKQAFLQKAQNKGMTYKDAIYMWKHSANMYDRMKRDKNGRFVPKDDTEISEKDLYKVGQQIRSRSAAYTGIIQDAERTWAQTNVWTQFITMMRNFLIVGLWERFQSYRDFVGEVDPNTGVVYNSPIDPENLRDVKKNSPTGGFNFQTGRIENGIYRSAFAAILKIWPYLKYVSASIKHGTYSDQTSEIMGQNNINRHEIYALNRVMMEVGTIALLVLIDSIMNSLLKDKDPDDDDYFLLYMMQNNLIRLTIDRATFYSASTLNDLIRSITSATSSFDKNAHAVDMIMEALELSNHKLDDPVKNGNYKGHSRLFYHTFNVLNFVGLHNWYTNMPKSLGGGGSYVINQNTKYYKRIMPFKNQIFGKNDEKSKKTKKYVDPDMRREMREINREKNEFQRELRESLR